MSPDRARKILKVSPEAGLEEARHAFRKRIKRLHPDRAGQRSREAYQETVAAWRVLEMEARPREPVRGPVKPEPVHVLVAVSWLSVRLGETITVEAPHRSMQIPLPTDAGPGTRLRLQCPSDEPDIVVTLHMARKPLADSIARFAQDFGNPGPDAAAEAGA